MDRELFARIRRNRVDPSFQSVNNPAPDFYGEKVGGYSAVLQKEMSLICCPLFTLLPA